MHDDPMQGGWAAHRRAARMDPRSLWAVWGGILTSQMVFAALTRALPPAAPTDPQMAAILGMVGLGPAALTLSWGRLVAQGQPPQARWIVRWALAEAISLLGLVSWMTAGLLLPAAAMMGVGALLVLVQFPRDEGGRGEGDWNEGHR